MKCFSCGFNNLSAGTYCQKCGVKMNLTHEEIAGAMREKASREAADNFEYQMRQLLVLSVCLFLLTLTAYLFLSGRSQVYAAPSFDARADYVRVRYDFVPPREDELLPWDRK